MLIDARPSRVLFAFVLVASCSVPAGAQMIDDGTMMARRSILTADVYVHDTWDQYWEGPLKRRNANIGTITTRANVFSANYGLTNRLNVMAAVPYVWTRASQGVLHGIKGVQDLTLAAKYNMVEKTSPGLGTLRAIAVVSAGTPLTNYNVELLPLSIGMGGTRVSGRGTLNFQFNPGWYLNGSTAYTWVSEVQLDRPYFYTDDEFVMSDQVDMPNVLDYAVSAGFRTRRLMTAVSVTQQRTLGGGDIRPQDMPFVSNRMNFSKVGAMAMYPIPRLNGLGFQFGYAFTFAGRNVGQASTYTTGLVWRSGSSIR